ncbi:MAG: DUF4105 domain-containing protein [Oleispira sp.]
MIKKRLVVICCFIALLFIPNVNAEDLSGKSSLINLAELAKSTQWLHLLHYRPHGLLATMKSENDSEHFFVHADGKLDAFAELHDEVELFSLISQVDNESLQCRFPARYKWLKQFHSYWIDQSCSDLNEWKAEIDAHKLTLIFPASYLNSPSSMYGHSLIRLDREDESKSKLLAYSVNFAANADPTDNELVFSYKGLAGGYPGVVSILPYYAKVNEYSHLEHRDVWEYRLNLTEEEVDQFVNHIWETKDTEFDYFFFDENCSYRLLALLDASSDRIDVAKDFSLKAMPVDTIRSLINTGKVEKVNYRPSFGVILNQQQAQLSNEQKELAKKIALDSSIISMLDFQRLSDFEQAQILEVSISYLRYLVVKKKRHSSENRKHSLALLSARSKIPLKDVFQPIQAPKVRDDQGHLTQRTSLYVGQQNTDEFVDMQFRIAYHELMDLPDGFIKGGQIEMGSLTLRAINQKESTTENSDVKLQLQKFSLINILSLGARDHFQQPISWRVNAGVDRLLIAGSDLFAHLDVAGGYSYDLNSDNNHWGQVYGLLEGRLKASGQFEKDYQLAAGTQLGWLFQGSQWQMNAFASYFPSIAGDEFDYQDVSLSLGGKLTTNIQLRLEAKRELISNSGSYSDGDSIKLGMNWYF